jgi:TonB family protein
MTSLFIYLIKVSAGILILYLLYLLLFRKDTFYFRNRVLLILTLILPALIPLIKIPVLSNQISFAALSPANTFDSVIYSATAGEASIPDAVKSFDYNRLLVWIYCIVAGLLLLRVIISLISTLRIIQKGTVNQSKFPKVIISGDHLPPFSFFPYAVLPAEEFEKGNYEDILDHEFAHVRQGHSFDLLLSELFIAFQWFNPFVWLIKRSIVLNHEYLADRVSISHNQSVKEYQYRLLNIQSGLKKIAFAHNFNSLIKNRIIMINSKPSPGFAMLKNLLILPAVAIAVYAFATPEYHSVTTPNEPLSVYQVPQIVQKEVKGIVLNEAGNPFDGVYISSTGTAGEASMVSTGPDGRFSFNNLQKDVSLLFFCRGYKQLTLKPDFENEMRVKMVKDPNYKEKIVLDGKNPAIKAESAQKKDPIVLIDGVVSEKSFINARQDLGYDMGIIKYITDKEATAKYGEKGANGAYEITTRKKAKEMGIKTPFPRLAPADYPTFQGQRVSSFDKWLADNIQYPEEALNKNLEGWISVNFNVELNGTISNIVSTIPVDPVLSNAVVKAVQSSPKWDPPKNPNVDEPFTSGVTLKINSAGKIAVDPPFVVVEVMPMYPGGDVELLNFIKDNTKYPEEAKTLRLAGRVIVRFVVSTDGQAEGISVLKGVHPLLDAEAIRVISELKGFSPGKQGGKNVNVWYMAPVTFSLAEPEQPK